MSLPPAVRRLVPRGVWPLYHRCVSWIGAWRFGFPSRRMVVIGVTGTDGKTTTALMIASILRAAGERVGVSTTALVRVADKEWVNPSHMTMPGRFTLQQLLRQMADAGCRFAVVETSSEGLAQGRLAGIDVDAAVLTNLTPEHIESHGSFTAYRQAKEKLFRALETSNRKVLNGHHVHKIAVVNLDDEHGSSFLRFPGDRRIGVTLHNAVSGSELFRGEQLVVTNHGSTMTVDGHKIMVSLPGAYNASNALEAAAVCQAYDIPWSAIVKGLADLKEVPGRGERIDSGRGWSVIVDYALTPAALKAFYLGLKSGGAKRIIGVFGAAGGGRDRWKRPELGKIAAEHCDRIILTTDDPHDEDPAAIAAAIAAGIPNDKKSAVETVLDRREAIMNALSMAQTGDIVAVTGMGSETSMIVRGKKVAWSDAEVVHEEMKSI